MKSDVRPLNIGHPDPVDLMNAARVARDKAYAPYSGFRVGAAVISSGGKVFTGANVENASYGLSVCAERVAIFNAVMAGISGDMTAIAVAGDPGEQAPPCGACRQVLSEFAGPDLLVHLEQGDKVVSYRLGDLLPNAFGAKMGGAQEKAPEGARAIEALASEERIERLIRNSPDE